MDPEQLRLLHDNCDTKTPDAPPLPPLPMCIACLAFTCCSNYPSSDNFERGGGQDPSFTREILNKSASFVTSPLFANCVGRFKQLPPSFRVSLVSATDDNGQPLQVSMKAGIDVKALLADPRLHRWWVQKYDLIGCRKDLEVSCSNIAPGVDNWTQAMIDKVRPFPVGLDLHSRTGKTGIHNSKTFYGYCRQRRLLFDVITKVIPPFKLRPPTSLFAFTRGPLPYIPWPERASFLDLLQKLKLNGSQEFTQVRPSHPNEDQRKVFWMSLANHSFSISPPGAGMDCHRTWEILALKTVPIVLKTSLYPLLYEGLPVVVVDKWEEMFAPGALEKFKREIMSKFGEDPFDRPDVKEKLTTRYWVDRIQSDLAQL